jgi:Tfp pilus assembly protein PilF
VKNNLLSIDEYRNNPEFYFCKGLRHANNKNISEAHKNLQKALEIKPDNSEYKFNFACFLSEMHRPKEANRIFNDILLNYDPGMYDCYFGMGCNCFEMGNLEKSAEYFEKYLYYNGDGEFSEEVAEMIFYLKLNDDIAHNSKFIKRSEDGIKKAKKYLKEGKTRTAVRELYKAVASNPLNIYARNLLTLSLMMEQKYIRAEYILSTVDESTVRENVWADCLCIYTLSHAGKHNSVEKFLGLLTLSEIENREDLLCVVTTLLIFNKIEELILVLEMYISDYNDPLIYCILLMGYALNNNTRKINKIIKILLSTEKNNKELIEWLEYIKNCSDIQKAELSLTKEYKKIFAMNEEIENPMYNPEIYYDLYIKMKTKKTGLNKKYAPIINLVVQNREIMYSKHYKKEIIQILNDCLQDNKNIFEPLSDGIEAYSAALEYIYCQQYCIEMDKEEVIRKYNLSLKTFDMVVRKLKYFQVN